MIKELEDIKNAVDPDSGTGQNMDLARQLADAYVASNAELATAYDALDLPTLVNAVDVLRAAGLADDQWKVEAWLLHKYAAQNIGGVTAPQLRLHSN
jgi:hypothetical protein